MLWEVEIQTREDDPERARVAEAFNLLTHQSSGPRFSRIRCVAAKIVSLSRLPNCRVPCSSV